MKRYLLILLLATACQPTPVVTDCPALKHWSRAEQEQILAEEQKVAADSILIPVIADYIRLRAALK